MAISMEQVRAALDPEEPRYSRAADFGPEALPFLEQLIDGDDVMLAAKATYLAGVIDGERSEALLKKAAQSAEPVVRVAAAGAARGLRSELAGHVLLSLLGDEDFGVRKVALSSVRAGASPELMARIEELSESEPDPVLRRYTLLALKRGKRSSEPDVSCDSCAGAEAHDEVRSGIGFGGGSTDVAMGGAGQGGGLVGWGGESVLGEPVTQTRIRADVWAGVGGGGSSAGGRLDLRATGSIGIGGGMVPIVDPFLGTGTGGGDLGAVNEVAPTIESDKAVEALPARRNKKRT